MIPPDERRRLEDDDRRFLWHPFTQMRAWEQEPPLVIERGEGPWLWDIYGRRYLDGVSSLWTNVHGHRHPRLDAAVREQLDRVAHSTLLGLSNVPAIRLARKLVEIAPRGLTRVFFSDNGSTAVEVGLKIAFQHFQQKSPAEPRRTKFVKFRHAYHGDTLGSVSVGGIELFHSIYRPLLFDALTAESPTCYRCPLGKTFPDCQIACLSSLEQVLASHGPEVAAVVVEPLVQGAAGMIVQPPGWLARVADLARRAGALLLADEVAVGFGRTGTMFACEAEGVRPDILALAKGLTGGYLPLAATLVTEEIYRSFLGAPEEFRTFFHGHTYTGNPLAAAAALATIEVFEGEGTLDRLRPAIGHLARRLEEVKALPHVGDVRQRGVLVGIELVRDRGTKADYPPAEQVGARVCRACRPRGVILRPLGNVVVLNPPLCVGTAEVDLLVDAVKAALLEVTGA